jgi:hypothetical protein
MKKGRIAFGWLAAAFAGALALAGAEGLSDDEATSLEAGRRGAGLVVQAASDPGASVRGLTALSAEAGRPLVAELLHGFAAEGGARLGLGPIRGARLGAAAVTALLAGLLALIAFDLAGAGGALLAPALLFLSPRLVAQGLVATPDLLGALVWLAAVMAFAQSLEAPTRLARVHAGLWSGALVGLAAAVRLDLWTLLPLLALHWLLGRAHLWRLARAAPPSLETGPVELEPRPDWAARLRRIPTGVAAAATIGPAVAMAASPWLWGDPLHRLLPALLSAHGVGAPPAVNATVLAAAALPVPLVGLGLLGLGHALFRVLRALRRGDGHEARLESLLLLATGVPLALGAAGLAARRPGLGPVLHALPMLALLGARALGSLSRLAWPSRRGALLAALSIVLLYPGLRAAVRTFPLGTSAYGEAVGGAPGAARRGWPPQDGGEAAGQALPTLGQRLVPGARILWIGVAPGAVARYRQAGLLRGDLVDAPDAASADAAVVARDAGPRDREFEAWLALGSARADAGVYCDDVPLVQVFARAGAWR